MNSFNECRVIVELDLDPIKVKLMHKESGEGWTLEQASVVEAEYRRFLYLMKVFPNELAAPSMDVDTFWHYHILDTMKYARDCDDVFGYFLHHFPYVGLRGEEDLVAHEQAGERMATLYEETFGETYRLDLIGAAAFTMRDPGQGATAYSLHTTVGHTESPSQGSTAYSLTPTGGIHARATQGATAYSLTPTGGTHARAMQGATAYSLTPTGGANARTRQGATAYSLTPTGGTHARATQGATAYSLTPTGGTHARARHGATAYSLTTGVTIEAIAKQDETDSPVHAGGAALSNDPAETGADKAIWMNAFFSTRPRLPAQATAN